MREITWAVDEAARKAGITCDRLTGGVVDHDPRAGKIVRFRELVRVGGKDMRVCLRVEPRPPWRPWLPRSSMSKRRSALGSVRLRPAP
jgi:hypothetical protein